MHFLYRNHSYKKIGPQPDDFLLEKQSNSDPKIFEQFQNLD